MEIDPNTPDDIAEEVAGAIADVMTEWKSGHFDGMAEVWLEDATGKRFRFIVEELPDDMGDIDPPWED